MSPRVLDQGLQRERTVLSWSRTSLGLVVNAVLVLVRHDAAFPLPVSVVLAALSVLVAALVVASGAHRRRILRLGDHDVRASPGSVVPLGLALSGLGVATAAAIVFWG